MKKKKNRHDPAPLSLYNQYTSSSLLMIHYPPQILGKMQIVWAKASRSILGLDHVFEDRQQIVLIPVLYQTIRCLNLFQNLQARPLQSLPQRARMNIDATAPDAPDPW